MAQAALFLARWLVAVVAVLVVQMVLLAMVLQQLAALAVHMAAVEVVVLAMAAVLAQSALSELFGPARLAHSHQQIQETCNGTLYSHQRWATF
jgi:hypothetical protein